ncbi:MAG: hypothetical protein OEV73_00995 [Desulfobulbaceae bacterium]|nr:hypothetical protein [Desulfobulbaceae bacterium]
MTTLTMTEKLQAEQEGVAIPARPPIRAAKGWLALAAWLVLIWAFAFVFAPWLQDKSASVRTLSDYIKASGIDAGAVYYTEVDEVGDADLMIRDTFRFYIDERQK